MSDEVVSILIGAGIAIVTGITINLYSSKTDRKYTQKNKCKYLYDALRKSLAQCKTQVNSLGKIISDIQENPLESPLMSISAYPAIDILADTIQKEETYTAYMAIYKDVVGNADTFFEMQYVSLFLSRHIKEIKKIVQHNNEKNHERRLSFNNHFTSIKDFIETNILRAKDLTPQLLTVRAECIKCFDNYKNNWHEQAGIKEVFKYIVNPLINYDRSNPLPTELALELDRAFYIYDDIVFQNKTMKNLLKSMLVELENSTTRLEKIRKHFDSDMIKQFIT